MATIAKTLAWYGKLSYSLRLLISLVVGILVFQLTYWGVNNIIFDWPGSDFRSLARTHATSVTSLAFTPDGKQLAVGGLLGINEYSQGAQVFSFPEGKLLRSLDTGSVWRLALSPDGTVLTTRSSDNYTVNLWRMSDGALLQSFVPSKADWVSSLAYSPDGKLLATGAYDKVFLWEASDLSPVITLNTDGAYSILFSPDGQLLVAGGADKVTIWRVSDGKLVRTIPGHGIDIGISPDGQWLAIPESVASSNVKLWRTSDGILIRTLEAKGMRPESQQVHSLAVSPDGQEVATGNMDSHVNVWRTTDGTLTHQLDTRSGSAESIAFSPDGKSLVIGASDRVKVRALESQP